MLCAGKCDQVFKTFVAGGPTHATKRKQWKKHSKLKFIELYLELLSNTNDLGRKSNLERFAGADELFY